MTSKKSTYTAEDLDRMRKAPDPYVVPNIEPQMVAEPAPEYVVKYRSETALEDRKKHRIFGLKMAMKRFVSEGVRQPDALQQFMLQLANIHGLSPEELERELSLQMDSLSGLETQQAETFAAFTGIDAKLWLQVASLQTEG